MNIFFPTIGSIYLSRLFLLFSHNLKKQDQFFKLNLITTLLLNDCNECVVTQNVGNISITQTVPLYVERENIKVAKV